MAEEYRASNSVMAATDGCQYGSMFSIAGMNLGPGAGHTGIHVIRRHDASRTVGSHGMPAIICRLAYAIAAATAATLHRC